ncbi:hypothetical protein [Microbulbifer pacificus]|uniref:hypothetical protein n=1 Tax=Microbulbifer pacificus TaxID=407164 RepID=UPI001319FADF|nr:hypothetical protein [Microbulbifer pacificus]
MMNGGENMITVTMPIKEYEQMKREIERLKAESIYNFSEREYSDLERNEYKVTIDVSSIMNTINEKGHKPVVFKTI